MVGSPFGALKPRPAPAIKFLCSYGGKILPRHPDGKLRYVGGETRVLAVDRSVSFSELMLKMGELCGTAVSLRCQLPTEDLDALISITSDEDLVNLVEEYNRSPPSSLKIRAFLFLPKSGKKISPPPSLASSSRKSSSSSLSTTTVTVGSTPRFSKCMHQYMEKPKPVGFPLCKEKSAGHNRMMMMMMMSHHQGHYAYGSPGHVHLIHNGNHWQ
ncbi:uncharacterized protein LOC115757112 [Rhodamnia argentea]|uniref:Uncharacterized protein LOC115757112 n=1 Tax=Rhodamnia argentea TaxID=178133 RepID=A0A8B8R0S1_9MYRT|nr:uncharacterized protein LOC115757112 [Rhodamnia argentea]XP_048136923.1 uncharacterized protein LOC115757112 [Rhodamnia argentea]